MNSRNTHVLPLYVILLYGHLLEALSMTISPTTIGYGDRPNLHKFDTESCSATKGHSGSKYIYYCPSMQDIHVWMSVIPGKLVNISCNSTYNFTSVDVIFGQVEKFQSQNCSLVDEFSDIFRRWAMGKTEAWDLQGFSDINFVLRKEHFDGVDVSSVKMIFMHYSNIIGIEPNAFYDFIKLEKISLKWNKIEAMPDFRYSRSLTFLDFGDNRLRVLPEQLPTPNLQGLLLWSNNITTINESFLANATELRILELSKNQIKILPEKLIKPLTKLKQINLSENEFVEIPANFFETNTAITEIRLNSLNVRSIPENIFSGLFNLSKLMLQRNLLENLPETLFANQSNLHSVYMDDNRLNNLPNNIFKNCKKLEILDLSGNRLSSWNSVLSQDMESLTTLDLSENNFVDIKSNYFFGLSSLKTLNLRKNNISSIAEDAFNQLRLNTLSLSHNHLTDDDGISFISGLPSVQNLMLGNNFFQTIPSGIETKRIQLLDLSRNRIKSIYLQQLMNVAESDFRNNEIEDIDFRNIDVILKASASDIKSISVNVDNSTIDCGCTAFNLVEFFDGTRTYMNKISIVGDVRCRAPSSMTGISVRRLRSDQFTCDYSEIYSCPKECSCNLYPKHQSFNVSCVDRNLKTPPVIPRFMPARYRSTPASFGMFSIMKLQVDLRNNSIATFTEKDSSYVNVSELNLSNNQLKSVDWVPLKIEVLELDHNRLENLGEKAIAMLNSSKTLKRLTLHENTWKCHCKLLNFTKLIKHQNLKIPFEERIRCTNGEKVVGLLEGNLCGFENQAALVAVGTCFFIFLIAIGVALILYYKYEYHVKVWLYGSPLFRRFVTEEDLDKDKEYDAFLSYSHKDEEFVVKELQPVLESGPNPYKLCIHIRDWVVGEFITKQIVDSVKNSRRTIIVLSPNFLQSEWATMEFRTAHTQAMKEGRHRLIVILYGDIDPNTIEDQELKTYLSTNTYVKWGDAWFWKKLKYALPHKEGEHNNNIEVNSGKRKLKNKKMENIMVTIDKMDLIQSPATPNLATPPAVSLDPLLIKGNVLPFRTNSNAETPPAESGLITTVTC